MTSEPLVSIILPVFNTDMYLTEAIQSILEQSYTNFELLVIDDCSTDTSFKISSTFERSDKRIRAFRQERNLGIVAALNRGIDLAQGEYVARMDADDISMPYRIMRQVEYLEFHQDVGILGGNIQYIDKDGLLIDFPGFLFRGDLTIRWNLLFLNPFHHPTVMMRKSIIDNNKLRYDAAAKHVEDYELWGRMLKVTQGDNLPDYLIKYRIHQTNIGRKYSDAQRTMAAAVSEKIIRTLLAETETRSDEIRNFSRKIWEIEKLDVQQNNQMVRTYLKIWRAFSKIHRHEPEYAFLEERVVALMSFLTLYPLFQHGWLSSIMKISGVYRRWPIALFRKLPLFVRERYHLSLKYGFIVCAENW